ncbi:lipoate--protein ligase family protein [Rubidibacter lacunae]
MAVDLWMLQRCRAGGPSCLRFYAWSPPALSLGYHQRRFPARWHALSATGAFDLLRRPTGGRAVLHAGDLTYAIATTGVAGKRWEAYAILCEFLVRGWRSLGVKLSYGETGREYTSVPNCFATATGADLTTADGYKLIGSAQLRQGEAILQHGSMRLEISPELWKQVFETIPPRSPIASLPRNRIICTLKNAARECLGVELVEQPLTAAEWTEVRKIALPPP